MPIPVSLRAVATEMDVFGDGYTAYLNKRTGELITLSDEELSAAEEADDDSGAGLDWEEEIIAKAREVLESGDYVELPSKVDIHEYAIIEEFYESVSDRYLSAKLLNIIRGSGAFRRFKDAINLLNVEDAWYEFRDKAFERIAIEWLQENQIPFVRGTGK